MRKGSVKICPPSRKIFKKSKILLDKNENLRYDKEVARERATRLLENYIAHTSESSEEILLSSN